jgi:hypothetical protein
MANQTDDDTDIPEAALKAVLRARRSYVCLLLLMLLAIPAANSVGCG